MEWFCITKEESLSLVPAKYILKENIGIGGIVYIRM
jgi:hypothetical protein